MSVTILRPRQRVYTLGDISSVTEQRPAVPAAAGNWWEAGGATGAVAVYQPKGATSYAGLTIPPSWSSKQDLSGNGRDAVEVTGPPNWNTAFGWVGAAGCGGLNVGGGYTTDGGQYSAVVRCAGLPSWQFPFRVAGSTHLAVQTLTVPSARFFSGGVVSASVVTATEGVWGLTSADGSNQAEGYFNGLKVTIDWTTLAPGAGFTLQCGLTAQLLWSIQAIAWYDGGLTAAQHLAIATAMAAL